MRDALVNRLLTPGKILRLRFLARAAKAVGDRQHPLGAIGAAVEHHVLAGLAKLGVNLVVEGKLTCIDDAHVHAGLDGVVEEDRVHRLAHEFVAAEREAEVRHAARNMCVRQGLADCPSRLDKGDAVAVMLVNAGRDRKNVGVENDVLRRKAGPLPSGACRRGRRSKLCARRCRPDPARRRP